jgi:hypothetical protein
MLLCVFVGTGTQLLCMSLLTIVFAAIGFLSPANRGSLMIAVLLTYVLMGAAAGTRSPKFSTSLSLCEPVWDRSCPQPARYLASRPVVL